MTTQARAYTSTRQRESAGWQSQRRDTSWANNETWYHPPPEVKNLSISVCLCVKSLRAKWIILQLLLQETHIILGLFSAHYIHKSPNLLYTAVKKIIITISTHSATPTTPLPFFLQISSAPSFPLYPLYHPWDTIHMYKYTATHTHTHTHTQLYTGAGTHRQEHTHTHLVVWFVLGVISLTQGTVIMYFLCSSQREEIRGRQTTAKPDTTHPTWGGRWWSGGREGDSGWSPGSSRTMPVLLHAIFLNQHFCQNSFICEISCCLLFVHIQ